jgi:hypothetical protein
MTRGIWVVAFVLCSCLFGDLKPVADAGDDRMATVGELVTLDAHGSRNPGSVLPLTYHWTLVSTPPGSQAQLVFSEPPVLAGFVPDVHGEYVVSLTVNRASTASDPVQVKITARGLPPVAIPGEDFDVVRGETVMLDGGASRDVPDHYDVTFRWSLLSRPAGSAAQIAGVTQATATFVADVLGEYDVKLEVTNVYGETASATLRVRAVAPRPIAVAGPDQAVPARGPVHLDGSGSFDPQGDPLSYAWRIVSRPDGSAAELVDATTPFPWFVPDVAGSYFVSLSVSDGTSMVSDDLVVIASERDPVANAGPNQAGFVGTRFELDGSGSDANGDPLTYTWTFEEPSQGGHGTLEDADQAHAALVVDTEGTYTVRLTVSDGRSTTISDAVISAYRRSTPLPYVVVDASKSAALDRLVLVSDAPPELHVFDPATGMESTTGLPVSPIAVSVSPDGLLAAVGGAAKVTIVDLASSSIVTSVDLPFGVGDVVMGRPGWAYAFSAASPPQRASIDLANGTVVVADELRVMHGSLQADGRWLFASDGLAGVEVFDTRTGPAVLVWSSHTFADCGKMWTPADGRLYTGCGAGYTFDDPVLGLQPIPTPLGGGAVGIDATSTAFVAVGSGNPSHALAGGPFFTLSAVYFEGAFYTAHGVWVFLSADATSVHFLLRFGEAIQPHDFVMTYPYPWIP